MDLSGVEIDQYFEFMDEDEQRYVREGEELEDIYEDELSELEGEELQQSLRLVMEDQIGRVEQRKSGPPAARTEREHRQKARKAEEINQKIRQGWAELSSVKE